MSAAVCGLRYKARVHGAAMPVCTLPPGHDGDHGQAKPDVLGIELADALPDGWQPQGVIVLVRAIDSDGRRRTTYLEGGDIMLWEATGMLNTAGRSYGARLDALTATLDGKPL